MKKLMISMIAITLVTINIIAQTDKNKKVKPIDIVYTLSPFELANSELKQSIEFKNENGKNSFLFMPSVRYKSRENDYTLGLTAEMQYRIFVNHEQFKENPFAGRLYLAPFGKISYFKDHNDWTVEEAIESTLIAGEFGSLFGWQKIFSNKFTMDFGVGGSIRLKTESVNNDTYKGWAFDDYNFWSLGFQGIKPKVQIGIGYAFSK